MVWRAGVAAGLAVSLTLLLATAATADPFAQAKLVSAGGGGTAYSLAVSADGSTVVAGAPGANSLQGAVYVFQHGSGGWSNSSAPAVLTASDGAASNQLGLSVAVSSDGSVIVASAPDAADVSGGTQRGAVYVFVRPSGGWSSGTQKAKLTVSGAADFDRLGSAVAVDGDGSEVVAGAASVNSYEGAVYVFSQPMNGWADSSTPSKTLTVSGGAADDDLGASVAVSAGGSVVVAGAPGVDSGAGAAYVFQPSPIVFDDWSVATLTASSPTAGDGLGTSVATSGGEVVAGAPNVDSTKGAAYVFVKPPSHSVLLDNWTSTTDAAELTVPEAAAGTAVGWSVAMSPDGSLIVAGAPTTTSPVTSATGAGSAYTFAGSGSVWSNGPQLTASDGAVGDALAWAVSVSSEGLIVAGAPRVHSGAGAAYVFTAPSSTSVGCDPAIVDVGMAATCTATVSDTGAGAISPSGVVQFTTDSGGSFSGGGAGPSCALLATAVAGTSACDITYTPAAAGSGTNTISGAYGGDGGHGSSHGSTQLGVELLTTSAAVVCGPRSVSVGHPSTCVATVTDAGPGASGPTGLVHLASDSPGSFSPLGDCVLRSGKVDVAESCSARYTPSAVGFGVHEISVQYAGDEGHGTSFGTTQLIVTRAATSSAVRCRPSRLPAGRATACVATVTERGPGTSAATGRVHFSNSARGSWRGGASCRLKRTRTPGVAACRGTYVPARPGRYKITAAYAGDVNHLASSGSARLRAVRHRSR